MSKRIFLFLLLLFIVSKFIFAKENYVKKSEFGGTLGYSNGATFWFTLSKKINFRIDYDWYAFDRPFTFSTNILTPAILYYLNKESELPIYIGIGLVKMLDDTLTKQILDIGRIYVCGTKYSVNDKISVYGEFAIYDRKAYEYRELAFGTGFLLKLF